MRERECVRTSQWKTVLSFSILFTFYRRRSPGRTRTLANPPPIRDSRRVLHVYLWERRERRRRYCDSDRTAAEERFWQRKKEERKQPSFVRPRDVVDEFHHKQTAPLLRARRVCFFGSVREAIRIQSQSDQKLVRSVVGQGKNRVFNQKKQEKNSGFVRGEDDSGVFINGIYFDINL